MPKEVKTRLFEAAQPLKRFGQMKMVEEENVHFTLKFLGDAEPEPIIKVLSKIKVKPFEVSVKGIGVFPNTSYIRVIWAGCEKGADDIVALHDKVEDALKTLQVFEKDRDFHPHATLARVSFPRDKEGLIKFFEDSQDTDFGSFELKSFELMKSDLSRGGPTYEVVKSFKL